MKEDDYRLVLIEWEDSHGVSSAWEYITQCKPSVVVCQSVGWLIYDGKECKVLVPHLTKSEHVKRQGCGDMTIPTAAVLKIVRLKEASKLEVTFLFCIAGISAKSLNYLLKSENLTSFPPKGIFPFPHGFPRLYRK